MSPALRLDLAEPGCRCQAVSVSEYSTGPISDDETLIRLLVSPQHRNSQQRPKAGALADAERYGLSMFRESTATDQEILDVATELVSRARQRNQKNTEEVGLFGILKIPCLIIRKCQIATETAPCYCVYDTAMRETPSHAEAFQRVADVEVPLQEERRRMLFGAVERFFVPVADFRSGLLLSLAPGQLPITPNLT